MEAATACAFHPIVTTIADRQ
ncbi:hypothetical protein ACTIVE_8937 [Actinomadura verrucosospora]|uniref:Uncharacterized protein n=1 Tax=Actinomadura verrucosospora TaxID=46165 RepID=A0A7D3ZVF3_ACTVE|nr:hypothetical protein ACTIVE_8937 [Actinomadura verrucosospora]